MSAPIAALPPGPARPEPASASGSPQHRLREASRQFEAILLARVLRSLERTAHLGSKPALGGGGQYGSMIVEALSDAIVRAGGLGLSRTVEQGLERRLATGAK